MPELTHLTIEKVEASCTFVAEKASPASGDAENSSCSFRGVGDAVVVAAFGFGGALRLRVLVVVGFCRWLVQAAVRYWLMSPAQVE